MKLDVKPFEEKMKKSILSLQSDFDTVRVGRANPNLLSKITVSYWGVPTPLNQIGEIRTLDARTLVINPWDKTILKQVERAINESDLGLPPQNDGNCIRISFPMLTEERRRELQKEVAKMGEGAKVAIRNIRRLANDEIKVMKKDSKITEDEQKQSEEDVQKLTDEYIKKVDVVVEAKNKEIMEI